MQEAGDDNLGIPDEEVLAFAIRENCAVLTLNRQDFIRLHRPNSEHCGIIVCTNDTDRNRMADRINEAIASQASLQGQLIRVVLLPTEKLKALLGFAVAPPNLVFCLPNSQSTPTHIR